MRSKAILISECHFKEASPIVGSFDYAYILPFIKTAQDIDISELVGESLLNKIFEGILPDPDTLTPEEKVLLEDYIQPALVHFAMYRAMDFLNVKPDNSGLVRRNSENGTALDMNESSFLADKEKTVAESYGKRLTDYLEANAHVFPEYRDEVLGQIQPITTPSYSGGLWLGKGCSTAAKPVTSTPTRPGGIYLFKNTSLGKVSTAVSITSCTYLIEVAGDPGAMYVTYESEAAGTDIIPEDLTGVKHSFGVSGNFVGSVGTYSTTTLHTENFGDFEDKVEYIETSTFTFGSAPGYDTGTQITKLISVINGFSLDIEGKEGKYLFAKPSKVDFLYTTWYVDGVLQGNIADSFTITNDTFGITYTGNAALPAGKVLTFNT